MEENTNLPAQTEIKKHPGGRPTKYRKRFCQEIIEYFNIPPCRLVERKCINKDGKEVTATIEVANDLPFITGFARKIGVCRDTLHEWAENHEEFSDALEKAKDLYKEILLTNGLHGRYNSPFAKFVATATTDLRDQKDIDVEVTSGYGVIHIPIGLKNLKPGDDLSKLVPEEGEVIELSGGGEKDTVGAAAQAEDSPGGN